MSNPVDFLPWSDERAAIPFLSFLIGQSSDFPSHDIHPPQLAQWLIAHALGPLAYHRCRQSYPAISELLQADIFSATAELALHRAVLSRLIRAFAETHIPFVLLKGAALQTIYALPEMRVMSDIDLWISAEHMPQAVQIMTRLGYWLYNKPDRPVALQMLGEGELQFYRQDGQPGLVELHWLPLAGWWLRRTAQVDFAGMWARKVRVTSLEGEVFLLTPEDMILQLALHLSVNHQFGLSSLRYLVDMAVVAREQGVDWQVVVERARDWRVKTAVWLVLSLLSALIPLPGLDDALSKIQPSLWRRRWLNRFVNPAGILRGIDWRNRNGRYLLLLLLVDQPKSILHLSYRTLWPEKEWLIARYGANGNHWQHLSRIFRLRV